MKLKKKNLENNNSKEREMKVCFDVDGVLVNGDEKIQANIELLKVIAIRHKVFVWSGNGYEYAYSVVKKLGLTGIIEGVLNKYNTFKPDIAFDDKEICLGKLDICLDQK